jgi:NTP pyrophosphatase (non-canonical NTP hydrolase)
MDANLCEDRVSLEEEGALQEDVLESNVSTNESTSTYESTQREESLMKHVPVLMASAQRAHKEIACAEDAEMNLRAELKDAWDRTRTLKTTLRAIEKECHELREAATSSNDETDLQDQMHDELERQLSLEEKRREAVELELGVARAEIQALSTKLKGVEARADDAAGPMTDLGDHNTDENMRMVMDKALMKRCEAAEKARDDITMQRDGLVVHIGGLETRFPAIDEEGAAGDDALEDDENTDEKVVKALRKRCKAAEKAQDSITMQSDALAAQIEELETRFSAIDEDDAAGDDVLENDGNADLTKNSRLRRHMNEVRRASANALSWAEMVTQKDFEDEMRADGAADPDVKLIPGSRRLVPGGIMAKKGGAQFGFTKENPYSKLAVSRLQDEEEMGADDEMQI